MKLLMTTDCVGGVWTYALELAKALEVHDVEVTLATMGPPPSDAQRRAAEELPNVELHTSTFKLEWMDDPWHDVANAGRWLLDLEQQIAPDVIHLNGYAHGAESFEAPVVVVAHSCVLSWWRAVKGEPAPASWDRYRAAVTRGLEDADVVVVAPSGTMLATVRENYLPLPRARVIHNGRDPSCFRPASKETFVLAAGRMWDEAKNVAALETVAPALDWPVCVAGDGGRPSDGVLSLGALSPRDLAGWYARAAIYALPARYEPFGLSVLEAAMSGCALVLGDIPSLREIWPDDVAVFVPPDDTRRLEQALRGLIRDSDRRIQLARRARAHSALYTLARMGDAYAMLYQSVLSRRRGIDAAASDRPVAHHVGGRP
jgi:glycogen(starch) synthase